MHAAGLKVCGYCVSRKGALWVGDGGSAVKSLQSHNEPHESILIHLKILKYIITENDPFCLFIL